MLRLLAIGPGRLRLAEISTALQLPRGTAHGILRTLSEVGFVDQDRCSGRYQLGTALLDLTSGYLDIHELRARSMNWVDPLAARSGEAAQVGVLSAGEVLLVHDVFRPDRSPQSTHVGALLPAHATALGKTLLAYGAGATALLPAQMPAYTNKTITDRPWLLDELARVRERGYAVECSEHISDQAGIAAPVHGYGGLVVAAVAIQGHVDRMCTTSGTAHPHLLEQVSHCAQAISRELATARQTATVGTFP